MFLAVEEASAFGLGLNVEFLGLYPIRNHDTLTQD